MVVKQLICIVKKKVRVIVRIIVNLFLLLFLSFILAIIFRVFFFATFRIPTASMDPAIIAGDQIMVNKLIPGPRILKNSRFIETGKRPELWRLKGWRAVRRNDIVVFNFPYSEWNKLDFDLNVYYVKRCVALPGDTFRIVDGFNIIDNKDFKTDSFSGCSSNKKYINESLPNEILKAFPYKDYYSWTILNFGPLYVPRVGDSIQLDTLNIHLYKRLIEYERSTNVKLVNNEIFIGDSVITSYTFDSNYYFVTGDFMFDSRDSRYWGLLPEDHIVGKVSVILYSKDRNNGKVRWNRVLKFI